MFSIPADVKSQNDLGWNLTVKSANKGNKFAVFQACLFDKNKTPIKDAKLFVKITRPTQEGYDFKQDLLLQKDCYEAKIQFPLKGLWNLEIIAAKNDSIFQNSARYVIE